MQTGELTKAYATIQEGPARLAFPRGSKTGTRLEISRLHQLWGASQFRLLAREVWQLQPPFRSASLGPAQFQVQLRSEDEEVIEEFGRQMQAFLGIWHARIVGRLEAEHSSLPGQATLRVSVEFADGTRHVTVLEQEKCYLHSLEFEIRIFSLHNRQPEGIRVDDLRRYLKEFGGVHVYDAGFHLPYYGVDTDWLGIEMDHSHRLSKSALLPAELQVDEGLNFLPTNSRIFGVVQVDTAAERGAADRGSVDHLMIQVSRDRLVDNAALADLRRLVRWAVDYYATREALRNVREAEAKAPRERVVPRLLRVNDVLDRHSSSLPAQALRTIKAEVKAAVAAAQTQDELVAGQVSLVAPLYATYPLFTVGLSVIFLRNVKITFRLVAGTALTVGGVVLVLIG